MKRYDIGETGQQASSKLSYDLNSKRPKKKDEKKKKKIIKISSIAAAILIPCLIFAGVMYNGYVKTEKAYDAVEREYTDLAMSYVTDNDSKDGINTDDENLNKKVDFASLEKEEEDIYAWIRIPGTSVDYPILQSGTDKDDDDYWLNHNIDGSSGYPGTIFTERMFGKDFKNFNTVIYGHNMKNQTMFGGLHNYSDKEFFEKNKYVYVYTAQMTYKYEIICAGTISDVHLAVAYNGYKTEPQRQEFLNYLLSNAENVSEESTGIYDSYITLSTCNGNDEQRYVILAKCVDKLSNSDYD